VHFLTVHLPLFDHAEQIRDLLFGIGQQGERQTELVLKLFLRGSRVRRNAEQHDACLLDLFVGITKAARFLGASRRIGLGIEIKHHGLAAKIFQGNLFAVLVRRTEVRGFIINLHMEFSPRRSLLHRKLYRNRMLAVTLAASAWLAGSWLVAQVSIPQFGHKPASTKGPRSLGLIQLSPDGKKGRIIPIAIMVDGKFYDAGSYKAAPVPMALDFGIVYEGFRSGVSQGVLTITQPGQLNHVWIAEGTWIPAGSKALERHKKYSTPVIADEDKNGPPVLHRRAERTDSDSKDNDKDKDKDKDKDQQKPAPAPASPATAPPASAPSSADSAKAPTPPETAKASAPASSSTASDEPVEGPNQDPNRPRLRRGMPDSSVRRDTYPTFDALAVATPGAAAAGTKRPDAKAAKDSAAASPPITLIFIPAISDAGGPDPRPYTYDVKPAEEAIYRNKMLDLAAAQIRGQASAATKDAAATPKRSSMTKSAAKSGGKLPTPVFDDVSLRIFDLSNSNEPVLVLSAKTHPVVGSAGVPASATGNVEEPKEITLIARTNLEGELRKLFFSQTDSRHLDATPRMELIDAVDADGDGRGELLFRRTFDDGSAYAIYRVTADRLWPLFEPTP